MYQRKVDVDMLNAVKSVLADISSVSLTNWLMLETSANILFTAFSISTSTLHDTLCVIFPNVYPKLDDEQDSDMIEEICICVTFVQKYNKGTKHNLIFD